MVFRGDPATVYSGTLQCPIRRLSSSHLGLSIYLVTRCLSNGLMIRLNVRPEILGKAGFVLLACTLIFSVSLDILGASLLNGSMPTLIDRC